jgi:peptidoglycan/xylan/chitin deacetylase (PgdA/CDA1 family)
MYHRILPKNDPRYEFEEPGMIVEPDTFKMHLDVLRQEFTMVSLSEWIKRWQQGLSLPENACAITFDDGWLDNYQYAMNTLLEYQVPATLFVVTDYIGTNKIFWPNRLIKLINNDKASLSGIEWLKDFLEKNSIDRDSTAQFIYSLKNYSDKELENMILEAEKLLGTDKPQERALMNWDELINFAQSPLLEVGSHTCNHYRLNSTLNKKETIKEIVDSKLKLQDKMGQNIDLFCYPNGDYCEQSVTIVDQNYIGAVTTKTGINYASSFQKSLIKRISIHQQAADTPTKLLAKLGCWP